MLQVLEANGIGIGFRLNVIYIIDMIKHPVLWLLILIVAGMVKRLTLLEHRGSTAAIAATADQPPTDVRPTPNHWIDSAKVEPSVPQVSINSGTFSLRDRHKIRKRLEAHLGMRDPDIITFVEDLLFIVMHQTASDIHFQPLEDRTRITLRNDGRLVEMAQMAAWIHKRLVRRLKVLARLIIYQTRLPQDGAFNIKTLQVCSRDSSKRGSSPSLVASSILACVSQHLVRRLCLECRVPATPTQTLHSRLQRS